MAKNNAKHTHVHARIWRDIPRYIAMAKYTKLNRLQCPNSLETDNAERECHSGRYSYKWPNKYLLLLNCLMHSKLNVQISIRRDFNLNVFTWTRVLMAHITANQFDIHNWFSGAIYIHVLCHTIRNIFDHQHQLLLAQFDIWIECMVYGNLSVLSRGMPPSPLRGKKPKASTFQVQNH